MLLYGVEEWADQGRDWNPPLFFKQYLCLLMRHDFWGNEVVLYVISSHVVHEDHCAQHKDHAGAQDQA